jgi:hypothetical protein
MLNRRPRKFDFRQTEGAVFYFSHRAIATTMARPSLVRERKALMVVGIALRGLARIVVR